ncbi:SPOR domain-containing protein [Aureimonas sp. SK2]|uniref:SPOR domain-containing protein n=1 Tax=Aureimonas sp. SK2 TaxID=3015992 RepID=UPI002445109B|nr:SPOR domain-containing protein [Aureimonas sp. SK2]
MKDAKGFGGRSAGEGDRYSDVARHVDPPMAPARSQAGPYSGFEPVEVRSDDWESFTYEPKGTAPQIQVGAGDRAAAAPAPGSLPRGIRGSGDADRQIEEALLGLSMPARPRNTNPAETQSFAPARDSDFELEPRQPITLDDFDELINSELAAIRNPTPQPTQRDEAFAQMFDDELDAEGHYEPYDDYPVRKPSRLRGVMLMGGVAVVAIVAVAGASTLLLGGGGVGSSGDGSLLIKADAEPYKIAPVDPGGKTIPNQNKAVYQKVSGVSSATPPKQEALVTAMEEPIDIADEDDAPVDSLPGVEVGEQIPLPGKETAEAAKPKADDGTLQPRKVRTLSVRPDGTLVATEVPAAGTSLLTAATSMEAHAATLDPVAGIAPQMPFGMDQPEITTASTAPQPVEAAAAPAPVEVPAAAPETAPQQVAALEEAPAPADAFFVQIASQPSQEAAQQSLSNLGKRYSSVIGGRSLGIKSAEIPGKGTYYRVRVATASRSEANSLCESLKSAGGSCFVTR